MGLGLPGDAWWRTVPVLARSLRVVTFDNRGSGRSELSGRPALDRGHGRGRRRRARRGGHRARPRVRDVDGRHDRPGTRAAVSGSRRRARARRHLAGRRRRDAARPPRRWPSSRAAPRCPTRRAAGRPCPYVYSERTRRSGGAAHRRGLRAPAVVPFDPDGYGAQLAAAAGARRRRRGSVTSPRRRWSCTAPRTGWCPRRTAARWRRRSRVPSCSLLDDAAHLYTTDEPAADEAVLEFLHAR